MTTEELDKLLAEWESACVFAHGGKSRKTPTLVAAKLMVAGDKIVDALKELHEQRRREESR